MFNQVPFLLAHTTLSLKVIETQNTKNRLAVEYSFSFNFALDFEKHSDSFLCIAQWSEIDFISTSIRTLQITKPSHVSLDNVVTFC